MVEVYAVKIDEPIENELYNQLYIYISDEKRQQIKKLHFIEDVKRTLYGDLLVRYLASDRLKVSNNELNFDFNEFGKPFLRNHTKFQYNISHSGDWVVCGIADKKIGIDIEQIKPIDFNIIAQRFFTESEYKNLLLQRADLQLSYFYELWTLKESYIKCIGKGLSIPLNDFNINIEENTIDILRNDLALLHLYRIFMDSGYKMSISSEDTIVRPKVNLLSINIIRDKLTCFVD